MFKFLLLALLVAIIWWAWKKGKRSSGMAPPAERPVERMVACAHCGVHLPASDALAGAGRHYCCPAHRDAGPAPGRQ